MQEVHRRTVVRLFGCAAVAASCVLGPQLAAPAVSTVAAPCVNGIVPLNPYVQNCNLPTRQPRVRGAAPDAGAIIACRDNPWCLSDYVNGQYGWG
ncbi:hypothetical protein BH09ACT8_BH09ACT8_08210 [soil metagenome]